MVDPNSEDIKGRTPLSYAAEGGNDAIVELLLENETVIADSPDKAGRTPLWYAVSTQKITTARLLLQNEKVDPNSRNARGGSPLSQAAQDWTKDIMICRDLFTTGNVNPSSQDDKGLTRARRAITDAWEELVVLLLGTGRVDVEVKQPSTGRTLLSDAARLGNEALVEALLSTGTVDVNTRDNQGITPLMWATEYGNAAVAKLLRDTGKLVQEGLELYTSLDIDVGYLKHWESSCTEQHGNLCRPLQIEHQEPHRIAHWVIDIVEGRLVPGNIGSRYIALSYVWHSANERTDLPVTGRLMLTEESLSEFQKPGFLRNEIAERLPHAVKDAMILVQKYGERYLWVDCLCIVQNGQAILDQVEKMGEIYSGAHLTIIAATASGRLNTRKHRKRYASYQTVPGFDLYSMLFKSKWASRGWTFQEHMLSKRAIIFLDGLTFWSCQECAWDMDDLTPSNTPSFRFVRPYHETAQRMLSNHRPDFGMYIEVITLYNSRDLTYPQDALPAISGVLSTLAQSFHGGFISGLPCETLDVALLWQPFSVARRRVAKEGATIAMRSHLPSWSWCGWQCPVDPFHLRSRVDYVERDTAKIYTATWQTRKLVQWYALSEDMQRRWCIEMADTSSTDENPVADKCHIPSGKKQLIDDDGNCIDQEEAQDIRGADAPDTAASCKPPAHQSRPSISQQQRNYPFLSCKTTVASLRIRRIFKWHEYDYGRHGLPLGAMYCKPVFELDQFTRIPSPSEMCHLICLGDRDGNPAGVLRRMNSDRADPGDLIELIAISIGTVDEKNLGGYHGEQGPLQHELMRSDIDKTWSSEDRELWEEVERYGSRGSSGREYHFYNVLWVERKNNIMYRRAAGRVPKVV